MAYLINVSLLKRNRSFCLLFIGQSVSFLGTMITSVAVPYQVYQETHSVLWLGVLSFLSLLPLLLTALLGGVLADRRHRQWILIGTESLLAIACLLLAANTLVSSPSLLMIFVVTIAAWALAGLHRPALDSMMQQIVDKKDLPMMGALRTFTFSFGMIAGPAVGGLLIAHFGLVITYLLDFASFFISLIGDLLNSNEIPNDFKALNLY